MACATGIDIIYPDQYVIGEWKDIIPTDKISQCEKYTKAYSTTYYFGETVTLHNYQLQLLFVTPVMIANKIKKMKDNKSPGVDGIPPKLLKEIVEQISTPLAKLFNLSLFLKKL